MNDTQGTSYLRLQQHPAVQLAIQALSTSVRARTAVLKRDAGSAALAHLVNPNDTASRKRALEWQARVGGLQAAYAVVDSESRCFEGNLAEFVRHVHRRLQDNAKAREAEAGRLALEAICSINCELTGVRLQALEHHERWQGTNEVIKAFLEQFEPMLD